MAKLRIPRSFKEKDLNRSIYDLSQSKVLTLMQGLNVPVKFEILKPKDELTLDYRSMIQSMPMVGQQLNDWKLRVMLFKSNLSNYYSWMDNNARLTTEEQEGKFHHYISTRIFDSIDSINIWRDIYPELYGGNVIFDTVASDILSPVVPSADLDLYAGNVLPLTYERTYHFGVQPGSLLDMVEFPVGFMASRGSDFVYPDLGPKPGNSFNADYILCYLDAVRNYLVNNQLDSVPYLASLPNIVYSGIGFVVECDRKPYFGSLRLKTIDNFLRYLRMQDNGVDLIQAAWDFSSSDSSQEKEMALWLAMLKFGGLFLAQYERDMLNGLLRSVNMEDVKITIGQDGSFSINEFRFANRKQLKKDRQGIAGGRWKNLLLTLWGVDNNAKMDIPEIVHTSSYYVSAKSVMSNANTESSDGESGSALGQLGGVFNTHDLDSKKTRIYADDHCIMFAIVSLVPDVVYTNGLGKGLDILSFDDEYYPQFDALGFQDVPRYKYNAMPKFNADGSRLANDAEDSYNKVVGKNIAFIDLISNINRAHGAFGNDQYFETWVLKREFYNDVEGAIDGAPNTPDVIRQPSEEITSYVNPLAFQYPFTVQSVSDPNFVFQIAFDIRAVRSKGKYFMPTLGK